MRSHTCLAPALAISLVVSFVQCSKDNPFAAPSTEKPFTPSVPYQVEKYPYILHGDTIIALVRSCSCEDGAWENDLNTVGIKYTLINDRLALEMDRIDTMADPNAAALYYRVYGRISGAGIKGAWEKDSVFMTVNGTLTESELVAANSKLGEMTIAGFDWVVLDSTWISVFHRSSGTTSFFNSFMSVYNKDYSGKVNVTVDSLGPDSVRLIGQTTLDTVIISRNPQGQVITISSNPIYTAFIFDPLNPICPNPKYPSWLEDQFLAGNKL